MRKEVVPKTNNRLRLPMEVDGSLLAKVDRTLYHKTRLDYTV
jgi:hypothetical protein